MRYEIKATETCVSVYKCFYDIEANSEEEAKEKFLKLYKERNIVPYDQDLKEELDWDIDTDIDIEIFDCNTKE